MKEREESHRTWNNLEFEIDIRHGPRPGSDLRHVHCITAMDLYHKLVLNIDIGMGPSVFYLCSEP